MKKRKNSHYLVVILLIAGLMPGGCKKEEQPAPPPPPPKHMPAVKPAMPVQKQPSSAKVPEGPVAVSLDFANRKDPFKPFVSPQAPTAKQAVAVAPKSRDLLPIQNYELSKFKVAGIIVGLKENRALVIDPTGKGYVVKQGMLIGSNEGRISKITATVVEVVESYNEDGRIRKKTSRLTLPQKK